MFINSKLSRLFFKLKAPVSLLIPLLLVVTFAQAQDLEQINLNENGISTYVGEDPFISSSGRFVVFIGSFLLPEDVNGSQAYLYDRELKTTELISQAADGASANGSVWMPEYTAAKVVSEDGRYVVFQSNATNLPGTLNPGNLRHIYIRDRQSGTTSLVSADSDGNVENQRSWDFSIAPDGWGVLFNSSANNLDAKDTDNLINTYLHDLSDRSTKLACYDKSGDKIDSCRKISLGCTGSMAFISANDDTAPDDLHPGLDVFFGIPLNGTNVIVSAGPSGEAGNSISYTAPAISCDSNRIAFGTKSSLSLADTDTDWDLYVYDLSTGIAALVRGPSNTSFRPTEVAMSPDGTWISFKTLASLDGLDNNGNITDVYAVKYTRDRVLGEVRLVSQDFGQVGTGNSTFPAVADNGAVAIESASSNFSPSTNPNLIGRNVFVDAYIVILRDGFEQ